MLCVHGHSVHTPNPNDLATHSLVETVDDQNEFLQRGSVFVRYAVDKSPCKANMHSDVQKP